MYPVTLQASSAARDREMRAQAAAWRRAREARSAPRARPAGIPFVLIACLTRNARPLPWQRRRQGPAAA